MPLNNISAMVHIYVQLHYYCSLHTDCTYTVENLLLLFTMLLPCLCQQQICPSNAKYMPQMKIISHEDMRQLCQYIYIYIIWTPCNQQCDQKWWYTFHIIGICPEQMCLPLHFYCTLHSPKTTTHISNITNKMNFNLACYCYICANNKYALKLYIYATCPNYSMCINKRSRLIYMQHRKSLA